MCGLCGSFTQQGVSLGKRDRMVRARTLEALLIANQVRGIDSAGVAAIQPDGKYDVLKVATTPAKFVDRDDVQRLLRTDAPLMIGHTRMTSMGNDVRDENAHPFVEGNVIGAHNGVINNYMQIDKTVRVDSQAVFRLLDQHNENLDYAFSRISGSAALTWWDGRDPNALYLVAHSNPLSVAIVDRIKTVFWSSIDDHLETVMRASYGKGVSYIEVKPDTVYRIDGEDVYRWQEGKVSFASYTQQRYVYSAGAIKPYASPSLGWDGWDEDEAAAYEEYTGSRLPVTVPKDLPEPMTKEEEDRYEAVWNKMMADENSPSESEGESENACAVKPNRIHDIPNSERFDIDAVDGLDCGYCEKPVGANAAWDSGLEMMLCRPCQTWWDRYGHYMKNPEKQSSYPLAKA